jgi:hypothetical protein
VAYVAAEADYSQPHGFVIACQQNEKVLDIDRLMDKFDANQPIPGGLYEAHCVIIDPWAGITRELTPETVADLKWKWIEHVMKVDLSTPAGDAEGQTARILRTAGHASFVPESIPSDEEIIAAICDPFEIPENTDPKSDEICNDGIDDDAIKGIIVSVVLPFLQNCKKDGAAMVRMVIFRAECSVIAGFLAA